MLINITKIMFFFEGRLPLEGAHIYEASVGTVDNMRGH